MLLDFDERLAHVTVLDPACGSGNFLYVALHRLLGLEKEVIAYAAKHGVSLLPKVLPTQLAGLEINPYAAELAQVAIWIGYLQWMRDNGFSPPSHPVLEPITSIKRQDAILDLSDPQNPLEPEWPAAEFIVGNPPFLGGKRLLGELGDEYVTAMRKVWDDRLSRFSDLCCFWFEKSREQIARHKTKRAGLLATQGIRGGANREVLDRIKQTGGIFFGWSDRDWYLDGATVHVSMVGFDDGSEKQRILDGASVSDIHANLTVGADVTQAVALAENFGKSFIGIQKSGSFDADEGKFTSMLTGPTVGGRPASDVLRPYWTAIDLVRRPLGTWIVDFGIMDMASACHYDQPFEFIKAILPGERGAAHFANYPYWQFWRPRPELHTAIHGLARFLITPHVSKHRIFAWADPCIVPSNLLIVVATDKDDAFGILQSRVHEAWALALGTQLREMESGFRYTATTCFETFPFPEPTDAQREAIAAAAKELDRLRSNWLNPPELVRTEVLEFPGTVGGPWSRYIDPATVSRDLRIGTVKYPRLVAKDEEAAKELKKRTLTNLYNQRPTWLAHAHAALDAAYGWPTTLTDDELLSRLLALNLERAQ